MKTVRRLLYRQILSNVAFVTLAFLALFLFFDLVDELQKVGKDGYQLTDALFSVLLQVPAHLYDLFPITLLIGSISALARLAQSSEFTILRTGGLGPGRALALLGTLGLAASLFTLVLGEWVSPWAEHQMAQHKARFEERKSVSLGKGGAWLREQSGQAGQGMQVTVNVGAALGERQFQSVRIFEFNAQGQMISRISAKEALVEAQGQKASRWLLKDVTETRWVQSTAAEPDRVGQVMAQESHQAERQWDSTLSPQVIAASVLPIDTMTTQALWRYTQHLARNAQAAQKYELQFWKKAFAPLACLVMMSLALPFAYLQSRSGGMSLKVFGGVMLGISFVLANHISSHLGLLHQWQPWLAALLPSLIYTLMAMSAFVWLVRNR
jgi:lipopolysaccharide export system permease protein